ncbi:MAG: dihydroorotase [Acidobacteria bacterium RIFCSPLOWO2_12_FULL_59_11]|nr:MAG: dihydroorotase [Acidobacteria bacterium RIFCSPLOWO2_12_FULL_59_11]
MSDPSQDLLIRNGRVIAPSQGMDTQADVLLREGRIAAIGPNLAAPQAQRLDASGRIVAPGFIDLHTHLREPGREHAETIESGGRAAAAGGFTSVLAMPNTRPVNDNAAVTHFIIQTARQQSPVNVFPVGAISEGSRGEQLAAIGEMREAGIVAISDDGMPVMNSGLMRRAMSYASGFGLTVIDHCEDLDLSAGGLMHDGYTAVRYGLGGISSTSEEVMVARNILLAAETGAKFHVAHLSTAGSVEMVREAKRRGLPITCEVTPHHFTLIDEDVTNYDGNYKMKPPLRSRKDREALLQGLADGTADAIASDHAPHPGSEKMQEFEMAPFGIIGLETALGLALERLVHSGLIGLTRLVELFSVNPARIAGLDRGTLKVGAAADITIFDPERRWTYDVNQTQSRSRNTPFHGHSFRGGPVTTIVAGKVVWQVEK